MDEAKFSQIKENKKKKEKESLSQFHREGFILGSVAMPIFE